MVKVPHHVSKKRKKRRWTKEEKRSRNQKSANGKSYDTEKSKIQQFNARVLQAAEKCVSDRKGVKIFRSSNTLEDQPGESNCADGVTVHTVSSSLFEQLKQDDFITFPPLPKPVTIVTKPLLICDINGVLCHRVRTDPYPHLPYRESERKVSGTPVIPRPGIDNILELFARHFCLAIWTRYDSIHSSCADICNHHIMTPSSLFHANRSAKSSSAQSLIRAIIPESIQSKLIFVWGQNQCDVQPHHSEVVETTDERTAIFVKSLNKVYSRFPLWNSSNTLLIDDSQEKVASRDSANVLHPPPMNGKQSSYKLSQFGIMDDVQNHEQQMKFFISLGEKLDSRDAHDQFAGEFSISALLDDVSLAENMKWFKGGKHMESCTQTVHENK